MLQKMQHRNPGMLLRIAMADACAMAVEYNDALLAECLKFQGYLAHPTHGLLPGDYTDDTEMSIANTKVLIQHSRHFTPLMFAEAYVNEFQLGGRRKGYSRAFQNILERVSTGEELLATVKGDSTKNGAAMRAVPFGVLPIIEPMLELATMQACITHDTHEGRFSARAVALMSHFALYTDLHFSCIGDYCLRRLPPEDARCFGYVFSQPWPGTPVKEYPWASVAITTVHAVADVLAREQSLMDILKRVIIWGGDTDSVAAIAWGIASARYQDERLPAFFERDLEARNPFSCAAYLRVLGEQLMDKYK